MLTVKELEEICKRLGAEYGHDTKVCSQFRNDDGSLKDGDYVLDFCVGSEGTLYLMNQPFKHGKCE